MTLTQEQLDRAVWGSGYGGKRHLVNHRISRRGVAGPVGPYDDVKALCSAGISLAVVDSWEPLSGSGARLLTELKARPVCPRCARLVGLAVAA